MIPSLENINDFLSKFPLRRNSWTKVFSISCFCVILICSLVIPLSTSTVLIDAQILSGQSRNNGSTSNQSDDDLVSILRDLSILSANLSSAGERAVGVIEERIDIRLQEIRDRLDDIADAAVRSATEEVVDVVEERIDTRLQEVKSRLDDIAAVAIPIMIAAVAGVVLLGALIIAFILFYWYKKFRQGRKHRRDLIHLSKHILQELKENIRLLEKAERLSSASEKDSNATHTNNERPLTIKGVSDSALKVGVSSSMFWDLPSNAQTIMLMLETTIDGYNKVSQRLHDLTESVTLNKIDQQTASKVLRRYDTDLSYYKEHAIDLSNQLKNILEAKTKL